MNANKNTHFLFKYLQHLLKIVNSDHSRRQIKLNLTKMTELYEKKSKDKVFVVHGAEDPISQIRIEVPLSL